MPVQQAHLSNAGSLRLEGLQCRLCMLVFLFACLPDWHMRRCLIVLATFHPCRMLGGHSGPLLELGGHSHWIWRARVSPFHDQLIASSSSDCLVNLYHVPEVSKPVTCVCAVVGSWVCPWNEEACHFPINGCHGSGCSWLTGQIFNWFGLHPLCTHPVLLPLWQTGNEGWATWGRHWAGEYVSPSYANACSGMFLMYGIVEYMCHNA